MTTFDLDGWVVRSGALALTGIDWTEVPRHPLPEPAIRTLLYMQDIESHTIVYLRSLFFFNDTATTEIYTFLACWLYEETFHGIALARFLEAAGHAVPPRPKPHGHESFAQWLEARVTALLSRAWGNFCAVHMTWGAINELTTLTGYLRLKTVAGHPVLSDLLERIMRDESRHFFFYYRQAEERLRSPAAAGVARFLVDHFWGPVGTGVGTPGGLEFMAQYLFDGEDGRIAIRKVDETIRRLPGFASVQLLEAWMNRHANGGRNGHGHR